MIKKLFKASLMTAFPFLFISVIAFALCISNYALAVTPDECCATHQEAEADGSCNACGSQCIKITSNIGSNIFKKAGEVQCSLTNDCETDCPDCDCKPTE